MRGEDLSLFFDEFAVPWTSGNSSGTGILHAPDEVITPDGEVAITDYELLAPAEDVSHLRLGDLITVDGQAFRVRADPKAQTDGAMALVRLVKVPAAGVG